MSRQNEIAHSAEPTAELAAAAAEGVLGPNPFVGLSHDDILSSAWETLWHLVKYPALIAQQQASLAVDLMAVTLGLSTLAPEPGDKRFDDPAWKENLFYRAAMQNYLAWKKAIHGLVEKAELDDAKRERARFVATLITDAMAPTNTLLGNPKAVKKMIETSGGSLINGVRNVLADAQKNQGMPAQVDTSAFKVGKDLAVTPGAVVFRNEVLELIQYTPVTGQVRGRPQIMVPPQINKYYVFDLAPGKSMIEYQVSKGLQVFAVSWRNPQPIHRDWGIDTYVKALLEAIDVVREITGSEDVNMHGACSGAMTMAALLGYLAARGDRRVNAATLMVAVLDNRAGSQLGAFVTPETILDAKRRSSAAGVLDGREMGRVFAWMRPNDLVWNYWVNNYLLGNTPPAFDVLFWNSDTTRLAASFHGELLDMFSRNMIVTPRALTVLGTKIDLSEVDIDKYFLAGVTDHITPWKGVYNSSRAFGGNNQFVLSSSGHIQSLVNPPTNKRAKYFLGSPDAKSADEWLKAAKPHDETWWIHWNAWLDARSGELRDAPPALGSAKHRPMVAAPGTYVLEG